MRVAIVGSGIAGLAAAHVLRAHAQVSLFESASHFGGHAHTVDLSLPAGPRDGSGRTVTHGVDIGFLVFNERTYPGVIRLFSELGVETVKSEMSFSVQVPRPGHAQNLEWSGSSAGTVFAQRRNLVDPRFLRMLADLLRFNALCSRIASEQREAELMQPLAEFLDAQRFTVAFRDWYLLPMLGCIWSCPTDQMLQFPVATMIRFCHNHGLLQLSNRPQWHTVAGGSRNYVERVVEGIADKRLNHRVRRIERDASGVRVLTATTDERFDYLIVATHSDQALELLADAAPADRELLEAIRWQPNRAVLHTDASVLPARCKAWAAWNYESAGAASGNRSRVCLHYLINRLQPLPFDQPVIVSLNPLRPIDRNCIHGEFDVAHPVFDRAALRAQSRLSKLQGSRRTWFAGAWTGYGFHEDGFMSGSAAAQGILRSQSSPVRQPRPQVEAPALGVV